MIVSRCFDRALVASVALAVAPVGCRSESSRNETVTVAAAPSAAPAAIASSPAAAVSTSTPSPPPALPPPRSDAERARLEREADACWADASCSIGEATKRTREAVVAGASGYGCDVPYYGVGMDVDLPLARACLERSVASDRACSGSSGLDRFVLATMWLDGQGGPRDDARGRALLAPCYHDISVTGLLDVSTKRRDPGTSLDFCRDVGGTTLAIVACGSIRAMRSRRRAQEQEKTLAAKLDARDVALVAKAATAWEAFAKAEADLGSDFARGGTLGNVLYVNTTAGVEEDRADTAEDLASLAGAADESAARELADATASVRKDADAPRRKLLDAATAAFDRVRVAETTIANKRGDQTAARAFTSRLLHRRAARLAMTTRGLD